MLRIDAKVGLFVYRRVWFATKTKAADRLGFVSYRQFLGTTRPLGLLRRTFWTQLIDLDREPEALLADMKKNTAYEIRRAIDKDGVAAAGVDDLTDFLGFYNAFADQKALPALVHSRLALLGKSLWLRQACQGDQVLAMHAYILDPDAGRARLLYSATATGPTSAAAPAESDNGPDRALLGRANRYLHYADMLELKGRGFGICDLGGVAFNPDDDKTEGIDQFKLGFGGRSAREDHYESIPLALAQKLFLKGR